MTNTVRIVAAIVDTANLTMYLPDGETIVIPQGDPRVKTIVSTAPEQILRNGYADVDLTSENTYQQFEEASNGSVSFFKVAKATIKRWFSKPEEVASTAFGVLPKVAAMKSAVEDILQHAVPVASPQFNETNVAKQRNIVEANGNTPNDRDDKDEESHTVVAVMGETIVPGVEKIKTQFNRATKQGSTAAVEKFLQRIGAVANDRQHSVEDLLKFMERGDLPIADDGSILIYKVLNKKGDKFVDCHTGKVEQWVGAYVNMDHSLVDHDRGQECSNGLHVARRGYVSNFSGTACTICKVAPEDVIAVPRYDANKMRVCGYHVIAELSEAQFKLVKANKPISDDPAGAKLLADCLAGNHIGMTHKVNIGGQMGASVTVTSLLPTLQIMPKVETKPAEALANPGKELSAPVISPKEVNAQVKEVAKEVPKTASKAPVVAQVAQSEGSYRERIQKLLAIGLLTAGVPEAILKLKKASKKGWPVLGVNESQVADIVRLTGGGS